MESLRQPRPVVMLAFFLVMLGAGACTPSEPEEAGPAEGRVLRDPDLLDEDLFSFEPDRTIPALAAVLRGAAVEESAEALRYRHSLAIAFLDIWLSLRLGAAVGEEGESPSRWNDAIALFAATSPRAQGGSSPSDVYSQAATALRPHIRSLLHEERSAREATAMLTLLDAAQFSHSGVLPLAQYLAVGPDEPLSLQQNSLLVAEALHVLTGLDEVPLSERAWRLAQGTSQFCGGGIRAIAEAPTASSALELLRRRCGFACTPPNPLGDGASAPSSLTAEIHDQCKGESFGIADAGFWLSVESYLAVNALNELARLDEVVRVAGVDDPARKLFRPHLERFHEQLEGLIVPGGLPFLESEGPEGLVLPRQRMPLGHIEPAPVVLVVRRGLVSISGWPRFGRVEGSTRSLLESSYSFPGKPLGSLREAWEQAASSEMGTILSAPWPGSKEARPPVLVVVVDRTGTAEEIRQVARFAKAHKFEALRLVTWPDENTEFRRPGCAAVHVALDPPDPYLPVLRVSDNHTSLSDTLGRTHEIPVFEVARFLPDIYAAVLDYSIEHPAIRGLSLELDGALEFETMVLLLEAVQFRRDGEVMASTEHLLSAPIVAGPQGPIPLLGALYFGLEPH